MVVMVVVVEVVVVVIFVVLVVVVSCLSRSVYLSSPWSLLRHLFPYLRFAVENAVVLAHFHLYPSIYANMGKCCLAFTTFIIPSP